MTNKFPRVQGRCPACNAHSLFLAEGGYITCSRLECPNPEAAAQTLEQSEPANVIYDRGWNDALVQAMKVVAHV